MALPPPKVFKQDLPPPGGFTKPVGFPSTGFRKRGPSRGPSGAVLIGASVGIIAVGFAMYLRDVKERNYYNLAQFNQRFERAYVAQAQNDAAWLRRQKELLDKERELMANVPGWVVGQRRYMTQWEDRPDKDLLDSRKAGVF